MVRRKHFQDQYHDSQEYKCTKQGMRVPENDVSFRHRRAFYRPRAKKAPAIKSAAQIGIVQFYLGLLIPLIPSLSLAPMARSTTDRAICAESGFGFRLAGFFLFFFAMRKVWQSTGWKSIGAVFKRYECHQA